MGWNTIFLMRNSEPAAYWIWFMTVVRDGLIRAEYLHKGIT